MRTQARFLKPTRFGDDVTVETKISFGRSSFEIEHRLRLNGETCVECSEKRVWVVRDRPPQVASVSRTRCWRSFAPCRIAAGEVFRHPFALRASLDPAAIFFKIWINRLRSRRPMMLSRLRSCRRAQRVSWVSVFLPAGVKFKR